MTSKAGKKQEPKKTNKGWFVKGDPRINKNGPPKKFEHVRKMAQLLGNSLVLDKNGKPVISPITKEPMTLTEQILMQMAFSSRDRITFLEYQFGKVPHAITVTDSDGNQLSWKDFINSSSPDSPGSPDVQQGVPEDTDKGEEA